MFWRTESMTLIIVLLNKQFMHHSTRKYVQQKCLEANSLNVPMSDGNCTKNQAQLKCLLAKLQLLLSII